MAKHEKDHSTAAASAPVKAAETDVPAAAAAVVMAGVEGPVGAGYTEKDHNDAVAADRAKAGE